MEDPELNERGFNLTEEEVRGIYRKGIRDWERDDCEDYETFVLDDILGENGVRFGAKRVIFVDCNNSRYVNAIEIERGRTLITGFTSSERGNGTEGTDHYFLVDVNREVFYTDSLWNPDMDSFYKHDVPSGNHVIYG